MSDEPDPPTSYGFLFVSLFLSLFFLYFSISSPQSSSRFRDGQGRDGIDRSWGRVGFEG